MALGFDADNTGLQMMIICLFDAYLPMNMRDCLHIFCGGIDSARRSRSHLRLGVPILLLNFGHARRRRKRVYSVNDNSSKFYFAEHDTARRLFS